MFSVESLDESDRPRGLGPSLARHRSCVNGTSSRDPYSRRESEHLRRPLVPRRVPTTTQVGTVWRGLRSGPLWLFGQVPKRRWEPSLQDCAHQHRLSICPFWRAVGILYANVALVHFEQDEQTLNLAGMLSKASKALAADDYGRAFMMWPTNNVPWRS
jgi:hypothetical protein